MEFFENKDLPEDMNDPHHIDLDHVGSNVEMEYDAPDDTYIDDNEADADTYDDDDDHDDHDHNGDDDHAVVVGSS